MLFYLLRRTFVTGLIAVLLNKKNFLVLLLSLEFSGLGFFYFSILTNYLIRIEYYLNFYILIIRVCEGALGLAVLVLFTYTNREQNNNSELARLC